MECSGLFSKGSQRTLSLSCAPHLDGRTSRGLSALTDTTRHPTSCLLESNTSHRCRRHARPQSRWGLCCGSPPPTTALGSLVTGWHPQSHCSPPPAPQATLRPSPSPVSHCFPLHRLPHEHQAPLAPAPLSQTNWLPDEPLPLGPWKTCSSQAKPTATCLLQDPRPGCVQGTFITGTTAPVGLLLPPTDLRPPPPGLPPHACPITVLSPPPPTPPPPATGHTIGRVHTPPKHRLHPISSPFSEKLRRLPAGHQFQCH